MFLKWDGVLSHHLSFRLHGLGLNTLGNLPFGILGVVSWDLAFGGKSIAYLPPNPVVGMLSVSR